VADFENILKAVLAHVAAARQNCAEAQRHHAEIERLLCAPAEAGKFQSLRAGARRVIEDGKAAYVTEDKAEELCKGSKADLVLDCERRRLRYVPPNSQKQEPIWVNLGWGWYKVLLVGLSKPGRPFGNLQIEARFPAANISPRTLSHTIAGLTRLLQGGGTKGPYIYREPVGLAVSETGWGYLFSSRKNYLVIEGPGNGRPSQQPVTPPPTPCGHTPRRGQASAQSCDKEYGNG
jgi:hypothetical protein